MNDRVGRNRMTALSVLATAATGAVLTASALAAAGDLDPTFSRDGKVRTPVGGGSSGASGLAIDSQGRTVLAGNAFNSSGSSIAVVRYRPNGTLDPTFSGNGKVITSVGPNSAAAGVAIDSQDRAVAVGLVQEGARNSFALARYRVDGELDPTVSHDGTRSPTWAWTTARPSASRWTLRGEPSWRVRQEQ
jgi:uncharacterized delta-60 repeat protein